jgi:hypothetical protein
MGKRSIDLECLDGKKQILFKALKNLIKIKSKY